MESGKWAVNLFIFLLAINKTVALVIFICKSSSCQFSLNMLIEMRYMYIYSLTPANGHLL